MEDSLSSIPDAIEIRETLPRPNWDVIAKWIEEHFESDALNDAWTQIARDWLYRLSQSLSRKYKLYESSEFLLLAADETIANRVLRSSEWARQTILITLDGVAVEEGYGKHVILLLADVDNYYDYVTDFYPEEGEFALSGGMFIDEGYGHIAVCPTYGDDYERIIVHELNHTLLRHLPLPLWLNESVTQVMEDVVLQSSYFTVDHAIRCRHREYWTAETIHLFWSGDSFFLPDDGQELSYHLSHVLFRNLMSDHPKSVKEILKKANFKDAGNSAFIDTCKVTLADRVSQFLGSGPWAPRSDYDFSDA